MIQICSQCGAVSNQAVDVCPFCEAPFASRQTGNRPVETSSGEPEWRREVARRLEVYRARRHHSDSGRAQPALPFSAEETSGESVATAVAPRTIARLRPTERVEIHVSQPEFNFSVVDNFTVQSAASRIPVAELSTRRWAGALDAAILLAVFAGFLELFRSMGGQVGYMRVDLAVYAAAFFLIYALYFSLFTAFSGATPGMLALGLSAVALDGNFPETRQLFWRCFGYVLSGGTLFLGFLWALWDEEHLTWQDRISQTYLTKLQPADEENSEYMQGPHSYSHHAPVA
ncbi:MAG TPA: RDD family protein [Candidatus Acidoferrales bacterium]|nr:RDD family protein [Candidatus Acidoferrales bacterium]